jgi:hypothetical protein
MAGGWRCRPSWLSWTCRRPGSGGRQPRQPGRRRRLPTAMPPWPRRAAPVAYQSGRRVPAARPSRLLPLPAAAGCARWAPGLQSASRRRRSAWLALWALCGRRLRGPRPMAAPPLLPLPPAAAPAACRACSAARCRHPAARLWMRPQTACQEAWRATRRPRQQGSSGRPSALRPRHPLCGAQRRWSAASAASCRPSRSREARSPAAPSLPAPSRAPHPPQQQRQQHPRSRAAHCGSFRGGKASRAQPQPQPQPSRRGTPATRMRRVRLAKQQQPGRARPPAALCRRGSAAVQLPTCWSGSGSACCGTAGSLAAGQPWMGPSGAAAAPLAGLGPGCTTASPPLECCQLAASPSTAARWPWWAACSTPTPPATPAGCACTSWPAESRCARRR